MKTSIHIKRLAGRYAARLPSNMADIVHLTADEMICRGIPERRALQISSAIALAREIAEPAADYEPGITGPASAIDFVRRRLCHIVHAVQEEFWCVTLDTKNHPLNAHLVTRGTLRNSLVHPREVFRPAISDAASCILVAHNHPSGDPTPSDQDISVTDRLIQTGEIIGIPVVDHIVLASSGSISIQDWRNR